MEPNSDLVAGLARIEALLKESVEMERANNTILNRMQQDARIAFWTKVAIWAAVIVLPLLLIGPIIQGFMSIAAPAGATSTGVFGLPSLESAQELLKEYQELSQ